MGFRVHHLGHGDIIDETTVQEHLIQSGVLNGRVLNVFAFVRAESPTGVLLLPLPPQAVELRMMDIEDGVYVTGG